MRKLRREVESGRIRISVVAPEEEKAPKKRRLRKDEIALELLRLQGKQYRTAESIAQDQKKAQDVGFGMVRDQMQLLCDLSPNNQITPENAAQLRERVVNFGMGPQLQLPTAEPVAPAAPKPKPISIASVTRDLMAKRPKNRQERIWLNLKLVAVFQKNTGEDPPQVFHEKHRELIQKAIDEWEETLPTAINYKSEGFGSAVQWDRMFSC